ncbi:MAG: serine/threonine-protein kinase [Thermoguttaceae bacterium]|jgi:serine/threonine protein kinase
MPIPEQLGPFRLTRLLGKGGMGAVYRAERSGFPYPTALKVLLAPTDDDPVSRSRFEAEIETLRRLRHPNIVRLLGFGEAEGFRYFAMEYVDGASLESALRRHHHFTWEETVHIGAHTARALRHAHNRGIIHRDIKPANILLSSSGQIKVSDYGIAHLFGGERMTAVDTVIGTLDYMSPEQASAGPITPKSDLFSFGALLYVLLAGTPPFPLEKKSLPALLNKFREGPPESVRLRRPDVPRDLDVLLLELLEIQPERRPPNAQIVQRRLESILEDHATSGGLARFFQTSESSKVPETLLGLSAADPSDTTSGRDPLPSDSETSAHESAENSDPDRTVITNVLSEKDAIGQKPTVVRKDDGEEGGGSLSLDWTGADVSTKTVAADMVETASLPEFTAVPEEEFNPYSAQEHNPYLSLRVLVFSTILLLAGSFVVLAIRRPSADTLYERIESSLDGVSQEEESEYVSVLRSLRGEFEKFLSYYPNDPRADQVRLLSGDLEYADLESRLFRLAERSIFRRSQSLSLIESAYVEALRTAEKDPEEGVRKFRAFLNIFSHEDTGTPPYSVPAQCVRLARRRLDRLEERIGRRNSQEEEFVIERLGFAESLEATDPQRAERIREGLRDFYGSRSWAAEIFGGE